MADTIKDVTPMQLNFDPYLLHTSGLPKEGEWNDVINQRVIPTTMTPNNQGFNLPFDLQRAPTPDYLAQHQKKDGEKVVIALGASTMHGVGATATATTIPMVMERALNAAETGHRWRVVNLAMGSWNAYQQAMALFLYAAPFDPDYVVVMDGHNDASALCDAGARPGEPMFWPTMLYYLTGHRMDGPMTAYLKRLRGKEEASPGPMGNATIDYDSPDPRFQVRFPRTIADLDRAVDEYIAAQNLMVRAVPGARVVLSAQPYLRNAFSMHGPFARATTADKRRETSMLLDLELQQWRARHHGEPLESFTPLAKEAFSYFLAKSALALAGLDRSTGDKAVTVAAPDSVLPSAQEERRTHFLDFVHLDDVGQEKLGKMFAAHILGLDGTVS